MSLTSPDPARWYARRAAILALPEAKGQEDLAKHLNASTDMTVEEVRAALRNESARKAAPAPTPEATTGEDWNTLVAQAEVRRAEAARQADLDRRSAGSQVAAPEHLGSRLVGSRLGSAPGSSDGRRVDLSAMMLERFKDRGPRG